MQAKLKKRLLVIAGTVFTGIGILGILVPILPTTPFLLLATACFVRSSQSFYNWLLNNRLLGIYISSYVQGKGMPHRVKVFTVVLLWTTIGLSMWLATQDVLIRVILVLVAVGVTIHIIFIKNYDKKKERF
ncbi:Inner membrane protein YbaN [subsurface metagenome]